MRWVRMRRRASREQAGTTLVELLVVIGVLGVIGSIVFAAILSGFRASARGHDRVDALNDLQKGIERVSRELRAADPLILFAQDCDRRVGAEVHRARGVIEFTYRVEAVEHGFDLFQDIVELDEDGNVISRTGVFVANIDNPALFRYFRADGSEIDDCQAVTVARVIISLNKVLPNQNPLLVTTDVNVRSSRYFRGT